MKFLTAILLAFLMLQPSSGATDHPVSTDDFVEWQDALISQRCVLNQAPEYFGSLAGLYGEIPLLTGLSFLTMYNERTEEFEVHEGQMILTANSDTGAYSISILFPDGSLCELAIGVGFRPL